MSLNKQKIVREIGRRTRLSNRDVQLVIEALIEVWTEELVRGGRIELENFLILELQTIDRGDNYQSFKNTGQKHPAPRFIRRISVRTGKQLKNRLRDT